MYEAFYGFREKPFSILPDPAFLYLSPKHRKVLAMMEYGIMNMNAGYTVITGDIGSGKTTLIHRLLKQVPIDYTIGLITNMHQDLGELLQWVLMAFDLEYKGKGKAERYETLVNFLLEQYADDRRTVLIVDEAQNMTPRMLEELRTLSNVNADNTQILQFILVGQPELRRTLQNPKLEQFAQRVTTSYHLQPLNKREGWEYIRHRIKVAGGNPDIMTNEACIAAWYVANGVPRLINAICDQALVYGYAEQKKVIDLDLMKEVIKDRNALGITTMKPGKSTPRKPKAVHS